MDLAGYMLYPAAVATTAGLGYGVMKVLEPLLRHAHPVERTERSVRRLFYGDAPDADVPTNLYQYTVSYTNQAKSGVLPRTYKRDTEIDQLISMLSTDTPFVIIKGPAGCGKSALLKGVANRMANPSHPIFGQYEVRSFSCERLAGQLGISNLAEIFKPEGRGTRVLREIFREIVEDKRKILLMVDELERFLCPGVRQLFRDNKTHLAEGRIPIIGATTQQEWDSLNGAGLFGKEDALGRRINTYDLHVADDDTTIEICCEKYRSGRTLPGQDLDMVGPIQGLESVTYRGIVDFFERTASEGIPCSKDRVVRFRYEDPAVIFAPYSLALAAEAGDNKKAKARALEYAQLIVFQKAKCHEGNDLLIDRLDVWRTLAAKDRVNRDALLEILFPIEADWEAAHACCVLSKSSPKFANKVNPDRTLNCLRQVVTKKYDQLLPRFEKGEQVTWKVTLGDVVDYLSQGDQNRASGLERKVHQDLQLRKTRDKVLDLAISPFSSPKAIQLSMLAGPLGQRIKFCKEQLKKGGAAVAIQPTSRLVLDALLWKLLPRSRSKVYRLRSAELAELFSRAEQERDGGRSEQISSSSLLEHLEQAWERFLERGAEDETPPLLIIEEGASFLQHWKRQQAKVGVRKPKSVMNLANDSTGALGGFLEGVCYNMRDTLGIDLLGAQRELSAFVDDDEDGGDEENQPSGFWDQPLMAKLLHAFHQGQISLVLLDDQGEASNCTLRGLETITMPKPSHRQQIELIASWMEGQINPRPRQGFSFEQAARAYCIGLSESTNPVDYAMGLLDLLVKKNPEFKGSQRQWKKSLAGKGYDADRLYNQSALWTAPLVVQVDHPGSRVTQDLRDIFTAIASIPFDRRGSTYFLEEGCPLRRQMVVDLLASNQEEAPVKRLELAPIVNSALSTELKKQILLEKLEELQVNVQKREGRSVLFIEHQPLLALEEVQSALRKVAGHPKVTMVYCFDKGEFDLPRPTEKSEIQVAGQVKRSDPSVATLLQTASRFAENPIGMLGGVQNITSQVKSLFVGSSEENVERGEVLERVAPTHLPSLFIEENARVTVQMGAVAPEEVRWLLTKEFSGFTPGARNALVKLLLWENQESLPVLQAVRQRASQIQSVVSMGCNAATDIVSQDAVIQVFHLRHKHQHEEDDLKAVVDPNLVGYWSWIRRGTWGKAKSLTNFMRGIITPGLIRTGLMMAAVYYVPKMIYRSIGRLLGFSSSGGEA